MPRSSVSRDVEVVGRHVATLTRVLGRLDAVVREELARRRGAAVPPDREGRSGNGGGGGAPPRPVLAPGGMPAGCRVRPVPPTVSPPPGRPEPFPPGPA